MSFTYNPESKKFDLWVDANVSEVVTEDDSEVESKNVSEDFWEDNDEGRPKKHRGWVATIWNVENTREFYQDIVDRQVHGVTYIAYGLEECPETGREHHQAFFYTKIQRGTKKCSLKRLGGMWGPKHSYIRMMRGNFAQNKAYCSKADQYTEVGVKPEMGRRVDLDEVKDQILAGECTVQDILVSDPMQYHMYGRTMEKLQDIANTRVTRSWMTRGYWLYGDAGAGKSHAAHVEFNADTHYRFPNDGKWWDNYNGQEIVIFDDFRPDQVKFAYLLQLIDKYPMVVPRRGAAPAPFLAKTVIITCTRKPRDAYEDIGEDMGQLLRRLEVVHVLKNVVTPMPWLN